MSSEYSHTLEIEISGTEVTVEVNFSMSPRYAETGPTYASGGEPAGGGEIEIDSATLLIPRRGVGGVEVVNPERVDAPKWLLDILQDDEGVLEQLEESVPDGPDPDEAYERTRDDRD